jgi:mono/diheme cytochrome c family protein
MTRLKPAALTLGLYIMISGGASAALAQTPSLPEGKGKAIVERACARCHAIGAVTGADHSPEDWGIVVRAMVHDGATLTPNELPVVIDYLAKAFPKKPDETVQSAAPPVAPAPKGLPAGY